MSYIQYKTQEGEDCTLLHLVKTEPEWAASRINHMNNQLTFNELRVASLSRCEKWHPEGINSWSLSDWAVATAGEFGELCNLIKKKNRTRDGIGGNKTSDHVLSDEEIKIQIKREIGDTAIYLDLLAASEGIDLGEAIRDKFNEVSERAGFSERL